MKKRKKRSYTKDIFDGKDSRHCIVIDLPSALIAKLPLNEQNLVVTFALAANELSALVRVITVAGHQEHDGFVYDAFINSQYLTLLKLYAGKIYETWELIRRRYFGTKLSAKYDSLLSPDALAALMALKKYFGHGKNIVSLLRNEGAFHYSRADVNNAIENVETFRVFFSGRAFYNELYQFADRVMLEHLCDLIAEKPEDAFRIAHEDISTIGTITHLFLRSVLQEALIPLIDGNEEKCAAGKFKISVASRKRSERGIPVFFDVSDYDPDQKKFGRQLPWLVRRGRERMKTKQPTYGSIEHLKDFWNIRRLR